MLLVAAIVLAACTSSSTESSPTSSNVAPTSDDEVDGSSEPATTVDPTDESTFESYEDLVAAAAGEDRGAMAQLALAEVSADLGPIDHAPVVDPALVDIRTGTDSLARLQFLGDALPRAQRDAVERWWAELASDDLAVYHSTDDPEYQQALRDAIDDGLPVEIDPDTAAVDPAVTTEPPGTEPQGFASGSTGQPTGVSGIARAVPRQLDPDTVAQQALVFFTRLLGGVEIPMDVFLVPHRSSQLRPEEYARATTTLYGDFFSSAAPGGSLDRDRSARRCRVLVSKAPSLSTDRPKYLSVVSHEVFHCWQRANAFTFSGSRAFPKFYFEGAAMWAGEQFSLAGSSYGQEAMDAFFARPTYDTDTSATHGYDGIGFWTQIAQARGGDNELWRKLPSINSLAENGEEATFEIAVSGIDDERAAQLASSAAGQPSWGPDWQLTGLNVGNNQRSIHTRRLGDRADVVERQQQIFDYSIDGADLDGDGPWWLIDITTEGLINAHWDSHDTFIATTPETRQFCTDGRCECPNGTTPASDAEPVPGESDSIQVALTGTATDGASVTITSVTAAEVCSDWAFLAHDRYPGNPGPDGQPSEFVYLPGQVGNGVLRPGDVLVANGGPRSGTNITILQIQSLGTPFVYLDSLAAGELGTLEVAGEWRDFEQDQEYVRPDDG